MYIVTSTQLMYIVCTLQRDLMHCSSTAPWIVLLNTTLHDVHVRVCVYIIGYWLQPLLFFYIPCTYWSAVAYGATVGQATSKMMPANTECFSISFSYRVIMVYIADFQTSGHLDFVLCTKVGLLLLRTVRLQ